MGGGSDGMGALTVATPHPHCGRKPADQGHPSRAGRLPRRHCRMPSPCCRMLSPCCGNRQPCCRMLSPCCGNRRPCCPMLSSCCRNRPWCQGMPSAGQKVPFCAWGGLRAGLLPRFSCAGRCTTGAGPNALPGQFGRSPFASPVTGPPGTRPSKLSTTPCSLGGKPYFVRP